MAERTAALQQRTGELQLINRIQQGIAAKLDFQGMNAAYNKYFGTADQPNKPARSTVQVAALVTPGALMEIEVQAVRGK